MIIDINFAPNKQYKKYQKLLDQCFYLDKGCLYKSLVQCIIVRLHLKSHSQERLCKPANNFFGDTIDYHVKHYHVWGRLVYVLWS